MRRTESYDVKDREFIYDNKFQGNGFNFDQSKGEHFDRAQ